jgi:hypothetical protein
MTRIERQNSVTAALSLTGSASTSAKIPFGPAGGGIVVVDSVTGSANKITWHACLGPTDTPQPIHSDGAVVETSIAASRAYPIPDACFASPIVVPVLNADTASVRVSLKG